MDSCSAPTQPGSFTALADLDSTPPPASGIKLPSCEQAFVSGSLKTKLGLVPRVEARLGRPDLWGAAKVRMGFGRNDYTVEPGLYALGQPTPDSQVLVTANYKLTFDTLRRRLAARDLWILVLDTKGINVWCAAGKGTMGTATLLETIKFSGLDQLVNHKKLILPQLSGPGVSAIQVKRESGFEVVWGPIRAQDLPEYLDNGLKATPDMRIKDFPLAERAVLVPNEIKFMLGHAVKGLVLFQLLGLILMGWPQGLEQGAAALLLVLGGGLAGGALGPLLLPWLPGRAFALKGLWPCLAFSLVVLAARGWGDLAAWGICLMATGYGAFMMMNFTGSSTYTSLSGVKLEMRYAVPAEISLAGLGLLLWIISGIIN